MDRRPTPLLLRNARKPVLASPCYRARSPCVKCDLPVTGPAIGSAAHVGLVASACDFAKPYLMNPLMTMTAMMSPGMPNRNAKNPAMNLLAINVIDLDYTVQTLEQRRVAAIRGWLDGQIDFFPVGDLARLVETRDDLSGSRKVDRGVQGTSVDPLKKLPIHSTVLERPISRATDQSGRCNRSDKTPN
jgi:hypothetical protein